jgi:DNA-binding NtrC family response regulator
MSAPWKGNIRELANILERAVLLSQGDAITLDCLMLSDILGIRPQKEVAPEEPLLLKDAVAESEKRAIRRALKKSGNNRSEAARLLGISRRAFYDKLELYGLEKCYPQASQIEI